MNTSFYRPSPVLNRAPANILQSSGGKYKQRETMQHLQVASTAANHLEWFNKHSNTYLQVWKWISILLSSAPCLHIYRIKDLCTVSRHFFNQRDITAEATLAEQLRCTILLLLFVLSICFLRQPTAQWTNKITPLSSKHENDTKEKYNSKDDL